MVPHHRVFSTFYLLDTRENERDSTFGRDRSQTRKWDQAYSHKTLTNFAHCMAYLTNGLSRNSSKTLLNKGHDFMMDLHKNKCCFDVSIEVKLPALLGNDDRPIDRLTGQPDGKAG